MRLLSGFSSELLKYCYHSWEFVALYDGDSKLNSEVGRYCGQSIPPSQVSSTNKMLITFHSFGNDGFVNGNGFKLEYNPYDGILKGFYICFFKNVFRICIYFLSVV